MGQVAAGDPIPLAFMLEDQATDKFLRATVMDPAGTTIGTAPMPSVGGGVYKSDALVMPALPSVTVLYEVFNDSLLSSPSAEYFSDLETFTLDKGSSDIANLISSLIGVGSALKAKMDDSYLKAQILDNTLHAKLSDDTLRASLDTSILRATVENSDIGVRKI